MSTLQENEKNLPQHANQTILDVKCARFEFNPHPPTNNRNRHHFSKSNFIQFRSIRHAASFRLEFIQQYVYSENMVSFWLPTPYRDIERKKNQIAYVYFLLFPIWKRSHISARTEWWECEFVLGCSSSNSNCVFIDVAFSQWAEFWVATAQCRVMCENHLIYTRGGCRHSCASILLWYWSHCAKRSGMQFLYTLYVSSPAGRWRNMCGGAARPFR